MNQSLPICILNKIQRKEEGEPLHLEDAILAIEQKLLNGGGDQTVPGRYVTPVGYTMRSSHERWATITRVRYRIPT